MIAKWTIAGTGAFCHSCSANSPPRCEFWEEFGDAINSHLIEYMVNDKENLTLELKKVNAMARADRYADALRHLGELEVAFPHEAKIWTTRAYVNGRSGDREAAIADWTNAIGLCDKEPHYFFVRGSEFFKLGQFRKAISDFTKVIELCDYYNSDYHREAAFFFRADAYVRLKEFEKARADCRHLRDERPTWTDKLRTKAEIIAECS